jgi:hypothetical protein
MNPEKIDYYTWKIGAIVLLVLLLIMIYHCQDRHTIGEINDDYYHLGFADCVNYYNITSDEQYDWSIIKIGEVENGR